MLNPRDVVKDAVKLQFVDTLSGICECGGTF